MRGRRDNRKREEDAGVGGRDGERRDGERRDRAGNPKQRRAKRIEKRQHAVSVQTQRSFSVCQAARPPDQLPRRPAAAMALAALLRRFAQESTAAAEAAQQLAGSLCVAGKTAAEIAELARQAAPSVAGAARPQASPHQVSASAEAAEASFLGAALAQSAASLLGAGASIQAVTPLSHAGRPRRRPQLPMRPALPRRRRGSRRPLSERGPARPPRLLRRPRAQLKSRLPRQALPKRRRPPRHPKSRFPPQALPRRLRGLRRAQLETRPAKPPRSPRRPRSPREKRRGQARVRARRQRWPATRKDSLV